MRELKRRSRFARRFFAGEGEADLDKQITSLEDELSDELDEVEGVPAADDDIEIPVVDEGDEAPAPVADDDEISASALIAQADALIASIEGKDASTDTTVADDKEIIGKEISEVEAKIAAVQAKEQEKSEKACVAQELKDVERKIASLEEKGIEDEIGEENMGGPSVVLTRDVDKDIINTFGDIKLPTNSEYVASITKRLDRVANILEEKGMKRLAFRVDQLSDKIESSIK